MARQDIAISSSSAATPENTATPRFKEMQRKLLARYGVQATSRFVESIKPRMLIPVLAAGQGEHDLAPTEAERAATSQILGGRFADLLGIGHFPFLEALGISARIITEFLPESR